MSRYRNTFKQENLRGPGDDRPTALQIVQDEGLEGALTDKVVLITGTSSGLGIETAKAFAATGAKVYCSARNLKKGREALKDIIDLPNVKLILIDQASLSSVRSAAAEFLRESSKLNILICNAGIMALPELTITNDGFESQFAVNHLSHFLLFQLLKPALLRATTPESPSRVIMVASSGHANGPPDTSDYNFEKREYTGSLGYGQSKTANIWMANEIERRYGGSADEPIHALSLHPGGIWTGLQIHNPKLMDPEFRKSVNQTVKSPEQGAATTVYAALSKDWLGKGGKYLEDCWESPGPIDQGVKTEGATAGYKSWAYDEEGAKKLYEDSLKMLSVL